MGLRAQGTEWQAPAEAAGLVLIGSRKAHQTHSLAWRRGVWFCTGCDGYAKAVMGEKSTCLTLTHPCKKAANKGGAVVLDRISRGLPPRSGMIWPLVGPAAAMDQASLEVLWPDRRGCSRKRHCRNTTQEQRAVWQRVDASEEGNEQQHIQYVQEAEDKEPDGKDDEYMLNEDEDPWHEFD